MAVVVVDEGEFGVVDFAAPLDGVEVSGRACGGDGSEGGVVVGGGDVSLLVDEFGDVFGEVVGVGVSVVVACQQDQRACRKRFRRVPEEGVHLFASIQEVERGDLQVAPVQVAFVPGDGSVDRNFLHIAAAHEVIPVFDDDGAVHLREANRAVVGVIRDVPY